MNKKRLLKIIVLIMVSLNIIIASEKNEQNVKSNREILQPTSILDRAVGFMDAGKMKIWGVENFGLLSGYDHPGSQNWYPGAFHGKWGEVRWIAPVILMPPGPWGNQTTSGPDLPEDRSDQYNAIESFSAIHVKAGDGVNFTDWEAFDNATNMYHGTMLNDNIPLIATSTYPQSWPEGYFDNDLGEWVPTPGEYHWPGGWALDPDKSSPTYRQPIEDSFVSNKDIFFVSTDKYNGVRETATTAQYGYPVGIDMETAGYSYSTPLYENVVFFNINFIFRTEDEITNPKSKFYDPSRHYYNGKIDSVYFAFFVDPDLPGRYLVSGSNNYQASPWAEDDYGMIYDYDDDGMIDVFLAYDKKDYFTDENYSQNNGEVSAYGVNFFKTPLSDPGDPSSPEIGITGFHWFDQDEAVRPSAIDDQWEKTLYGISAGDKYLIPAEEREKWFHGDFPNRDDVDLLKEYQEDLPEGSRPDIQFWFSSGPFSMEPGDTIQIHIGIVGGVPVPGSLDAEGFATNPVNTRFKTVFDALAQADTLYENNFIGFRPPSAPKLSAVGTEVIDKDGLPVIYAENEKVKLYWDATSENSYEIVSKEFDFQGYKIYKTQANVSGVGDIDWGTEIYDYDGTTILGYQPIAQYDLIDEWEGKDPLNPFFNLGDNSGLQYSFTDNDVLNGVRYRYTITAYDHPIVNAGQSALESTRGNDPRLVQTIDVIPGVQPQNYQAGKVDSNVVHESGVATASVNVEAIDPINITGHTYEIIFKDSLSNLAFDILDSNLQSFVVTDCKDFYNESEQDIAQFSPIFDGIGLKIINHNKVEYLSQKWINVNSDTSNYEFSQLFHTPDSAHKAHDYEIVFGDSTQKVEHPAYPNAKFVPFQIFNIFEDSLKQNPLKIYVRNPNVAWTSGDYIYILEPDLTSRTWQFDIAWNDSSVVPSNGDVLLYKTKKALTNNDSYKIDSSPLSFAFEGYDLSEIKVVPNPYLVYNLGEQSSVRQDQFSHQLRFTHLPKECTIKIYTLRGDHIKTINHESSTIGDAYWNLQTKESLEVSYGVYVYVIRTPEGDSKMGKFAVIW
ncbi:MAG: hypothetical protein U9N76_08520 [Candidatus Marinimicrobia bacterium]|nr:hypothetical protein [Candidatus Neomarinimicrobiota bacterium]